MVPRGGYLLLVLLLLLLGAGLISANNDTSLTIVKDNDGNDVVKYQYVNQTAFYETLTCQDSSFYSLCFRNCSQPDTLVQYIGITPIVSPTANSEKLSYDLKNLNILYSVGKAFMYACERTDLFTLIEDVVGNEWFGANQTAKTKDKVLDLMQAELPWFLVIVFFLCILAFLTIFVTFSILDGVFGWTDSTKRQKMNPSNGFWVNFYGFLIIVFTIFVLIGCLLCFVGNNLVSENQNQTNTQLTMDYDWSDSYQDQGTTQLVEFTNEFKQLLTELERLYNEAIKAAVDNIWTEFNDDMEEFVRYSDLLDGFLTDVKKIGDFATDVNISINIINMTNATVSPCLETLPTLVETWCKALGADDADDAACWSHKKAAGVDKITYEMINGTWLNVTDIMENDAVQGMINASIAIQAAIDAKIKDDVDKGYTRYKALKNLLLERTASNRTSFKSTLDQALIMAEGQEDAFKAQVALGFRDFTRAIQFPNYFFGTSSPLATISDIRSLSFITVNVISIATVFVGVFAWCVGCCNFRADQRPTSRSAKSHIPGQIIYYSSYVALFLSLFTITCGVLYFVPTSLFAFTCKTYENANLYLQAADVSLSDENPNFFEFWDDHLLVDYNILGKNVHGDGNYNLTFKQFFTDCYRDYGLFGALKLSEKWDLSEILDLNSTLDTDYFVSELKKADFSDQIIMTPSKAKANTDLYEVLDDFSFDEVKAVFNDSIRLFMKTYPVQPGYSTAEVTAWMKNIAAWKDAAEDKVDGEDDWEKFEEECYDNAITNKKIINTVLGIADVTDVINNLLKKRSVDEGEEERSRRKKRAFNWDTVTPDDGSDDSIVVIDTDYSESGIGLMAAKLQSYMEVLPATITTLTEDIENAKVNSELLNEKYAELEPQLLTTKGPNLLDLIVGQYGDAIYEEIDCFVLTAAQQIEWEMGQCRSIYDVVDGTMTYFCNFLVGPMTVTWMAFFLIGIGLTLYIQAARSVAMYFLRMDETHPDDVTDEEKVAAMRGG